MNALGNTTLVDYGIGEELPDLIRLHVSPATGRIYGFRVGDMVATLSRIECPDGKAYQGNYLTGVGKLVPIEEVIGCNTYLIPVVDLIQMLKLKQANTSAKGEAATRIAKKMLELGIIPIKPGLSIVKNVNLQIKGFDIVINSIPSFQVKCDWMAGPKKLGGSGNLFIQIRECNPFSRH